MLNFLNTSKMLLRLHVLWLLAALVTMVSGQQIAATPGASGGGRSSSSRCLCVPFYQCTVENLADTDAQFGNIGPSECTNILEVCCPTPNSAIIPTSGPSVQYRAQCGRRNSQGIKAKVTTLGIEQSQFGEFPWMAAILKREIIGTAEMNLYVCGGSLIRPNVVLTTAHCVRSAVNKPSSLKVRLGEWDTQQTKELYEHVDRTVAHVTIHEEYDPKVISNDYALLFLEFPVELAPHIDTICLPSNRKYNTEECIVTGWGKDKFGKPGQFQNVLKKVALSMVPHQFCQEAFRTTRLGRYFNLHSTFNCAGGGLDGRDACNGDGGSPLVCPLLDDPNTYVQVGMVAWGIGCGQPGIPGVYANVEQGLGWIKRNL